MEDHNIILKGHAYYIKLYRGKNDIYSRLAGEIGKNTWKVSYSGSPRGPIPTVRHEKRLGPRKPKWYVARYQQVRRTGATPSYARSVLPDAATLSLLDLDLDLGFYALCNGGVRGDAKGDRPFRGPEARDLRPQEEGAWIDLSLLLPPI